MVTKFVMLMLGISFLTGAVQSSKSFAGAPPTSSDLVTVESVKFKNRVDILVAGDLYLPKNIDRNQKHRAIVVGHPFGSVKEQTSGLHAQKLAELGFIALAFDASFRGESGGTPRQIDVPEIRVEDFSATVDYLSNHPLVDKERIGVLGICASGSYGTAAAQIDHRIKALATVSLYDMGRARREGLGGTISYEQRMKILDEVGEQRTREFAGESRRDIISVATELTDEVTGIRREFYNYYRTPRGQHPRATMIYSYTSLAPLMNFFPFAQIETISPRPVLFIVGENATSAYFSEDVFERAAEPKELFVVPGATHTDLYDNPEYMAVSIPKLDAFFKGNL